jgi:diguanylate cyclase (GGDEF)-like protein/PAS domain S-box-containing protein
MHPDDREDSLGAALSQPEDDQVRSYQARFLTKDGGMRWMSVTLRPVRGEGGDLLAWVGSARDIDEQVRAEVRLARREQHYRLLAENVSDIVVHTRGGRIAWISPSVTDTYGGTPEDYIGMRTEDLIHPEDRGLLEASQATVGSGGKLVVRARLRGVRDTYHWTEAHVRAFFAADGTPDGQIATFRVFEDQVAAHHELQRRARWDDATGLLNRRGIIEQLQERLTAADGSHVALAFCDLDDFKATNDNLGHAAGDFLLRIIAGRIKAAVRSTDLVARIGGDEVLLLLEGITSTKEAARIADAVRAAVAAPVPSAYGPLQVTVSVGVAVSEAGETADSLLARADRAMYEAKRAGRNRVCVARPSASRVVE